jgi:hypothetical protein
MDSLTWPDRIDNYRQLLDEPYMDVGYANGWTYGCWFIGNLYKKKTDYYGAYQGNFLKRIAALFPDRRNVLHLFSGEVDVNAFPGDTLDIRTDLKVKPTYCVNAETCEGVPLGDYDFVLADPPYSESDANRYGQSMVNRNKVVAALSAGLPTGAFIVWLDQVRPMYSKAVLKNEAVIGIIGSTNARFRVVSVFRKL